jgi:hypothetical protein
MESVAMDDIAMNGIRMNVMICVDFVGASGRERALN